MDTIILKSDDYKSTKWGGGETTEILIYPEESTLEKRDFIFRVSSATVEPGLHEFSDFTGYNRYLVTLDGDMELNCAEGTTILKAFEIFLFDGDVNTSAKSEAATDFNLIIQKGITGGLRSEIFKGKIGLKVEGGINLIYIPEGNVIMTIGDKSTELSAGDSIIAHNDEIVLETIDDMNVRILIVEAEVD